MDKVKFVDAPPDNRGRRWKPLLDQLREVPGQWALIAENGNSGFASMIKRGKIGGAEPGDFEAVSRKSESGGYDIYARYVRPPDD